MNRILAGFVTLVVLTGLWLVFKPDRSTSPPQAPDVTQIWNQQIRNIASGQSTQLIIPDLQLRPGSLKDLRSVAERITEINLSGESLAPEIGEIAACRHLKILHLRTEVGDAELTQLAQLRELEVLDLPLALQVTDKGLRSLEQHPRLKLFRLRSPGVTDDGLPSLALLPELRWLHLMEVPLTDRGLGLFQTMTKLESLYLDGDRATDEGLSQLVLARPDLHFHRDQLHLPIDPRRQDGHRD